MRRKLFFLAAACVAILSCTKEKTDYEAEIDVVVPTYDEFKEAIHIHNGDYDISIEALNGTFYKGYNEIRLKITNSQTNEKKTASSATFFPVRTDREENNTSCPHQYDLAYITAENYFSGYVVFTHESSLDEQWELYINFTIGNKLHTMRQAITVQQQTNKNLNMATFTGKDNNQYVIALVSPQKPKVGENNLIAGIYKFNKPIIASSDDYPDPSKFSYTEVNDYTLKLDPRMPEPSMGNHSSPNNKDLTPQNDGLYHGVVNYTMTGNWTLNFIMLDQSGNIIKGTEVPTDFTPGVEGLKSELHIDILF